MQQKIKMTAKEIYRIWAPDDVVWSAWVRPVPFITLDKCEGMVFDSSLPRISYLERATFDTAIILDLESDDGVKEGIALAAHGFRPIPLYNGTETQDGAMELVCSLDIQRALRFFTDTLSTASLPNDAPPVFLLDSRRSLRYKMEVSLFDNSWDIFPQDMPSADFLLKNGITKIILKAQKIQRDLRQILYKYQKKGIAIHHTNGYETPKHIKIRKPLTNRNST